jgi:hypothetical protein
MTGRQGAEPAGRALAKSTSSRAGLASPHARESGGRAASAGPTARSVRSRRACAARSQLASRTGGWRARGDGQAARVSDPTRRRAPRLARPRGGAERGEAGAVSAVRLSLHVDSACAGTLLEKGPRPGHCGHGLPHNALESPALPPLGNPRRLILGLPSDWESANSRRKFAIAGGTVGTR